MKLDIEGRCFEDEYLLVLPENDEEDVELEEIDLTGWEKKKVEVPRRQHDSHAVGEKGKWL